MAQELRVGHGGFTENNCAYDGAGLGLSGCGECGNEFRDNQFRTGWHTPIPEKLANYLISQGFEFKQDPAIARRKEADRFHQRR